LATETYRARRAGLLVATALISLTSAGCTALDNLLATIPMFTMMRESPGFDPYQAPRPAPPGSVPYESPLGGTVRAPLAATDAALRAFGETVTNPLPMTEASIAAGDVVYQRHCAVCHAANGQGNGPATGQGRYPFAPSLLVATTRAMSDGYMYGVIRVGRGLMPAYGSRINEPERWQLVHYMRHLQQQADAAAPPAGTAGGN